MNSQTLQRAFRNRGTVDRLYSLLIKDPVFPWLEEFIGDASVEAHIWKNEAGGYTIEFQPPPKSFDETRAALKQDVAKLLTHLEEFEKIGGLGPVSD